MGDIDVACQTIGKSAGEIGMSEDDLKAANDVLNEYGSKRESLLNGMVVLLGQSDVSNLISDWKDCCSNGKEALSKLNDAMPPRDGEGLTGVGLDAFYRGELKIWDRNAQAGIARATLTTEIIRLGNLKHIEAGEAELNEIKDKDPVIQEAVRGIFPSIKNSLLDTVVTLGKLKWGMRDTGAFNWAKDFTGQAGELIVGNIKGTLEWARKRAALKQGLQNYIKVLLETKDKLDVGSIDEAYKNGEEFLNSLWDGATGGDYEANDWKKFGKDCLEKLEERRDRTKEISEKVFGELAPAFQKRIETDFKTLFNDPEALDRWKEEIRDLLEQINSGIDAQENAIEALASGPYKETATQTMNTVRATVRVIIDQFTSSSKEVEDEMNKE
ncbi:MAG: hypothetical protein JWM83_1971 [Candidatus Angelobacter sp.]|nr:hypothetical protein [Candidatus Angelobacter sp.]